MVKKMYPARSILFAGFTYAPVSKKMVMVRDSASENLLTKKATAMKPWGFTLVELIVVVIIIGIVASIAVPSYRKAVLNIHNKEAIAMLGIIQQAEKTYHLEYGPYVDCADTASCNTTLHLSLPDDYWVYSVGGSTNTEFCATAVHDGTAWYISENMDEPDQSGCTH